MRNLTNSLVNVEVEWLSFLDSSLAVRPQGVAPRQTLTWVADDEVAPSPFVFFDDANLADFDGFATVSADDPRITASAFLLCRDGPGTGTNITTMTNIPAYPVGATLNLFQATMPGIRTLLTPPESLLPEPS